jgi:hypothetical protein
LRRGNPNAEGKEISTAGRGEYLPQERRIPTAGEGVSTAGEGVSTAGEGVSTAGEGDTF